MNLIGNRVSSPRERVTGLGPSLISGASKAAKALVLSVAATVLPLNLQALHAAEPETPTVTKPVDVQESAKRAIAAYDRISARLQEGIDADGRKIAAADAKIAAADAKITAADAELAKIAAEKAAIRAKYIKHPKPEAKPIPVKLDQTAVEPNTEAKTTIVVAK